MHETLNKYRVRSTLVTCIATWMLIEAARWSMWFATGNDRNGLEIAAIVAAIQAPATFYAGWAFKIMQETKSV